MKFLGMDKSRLLSISLGMNACFLLALLAWGALGGPGRLHGPPPMLDPERRPRVLRDEFERLFGSLDLTPEQRERLTAKFEFGADEFSARFGRGHASRVEGLARVAENPEDDSVFAEVIEDTARDHREFAELLHAGMRDAALELTPGQRAKLAAALRERKPPPPPPMP